jgi:alkylhydroperoxidase/carboxymuconolactone decarboxylase family protein YurZ
MSTSGCENVSPRSPRLSTLSARPPRPPGRIAIGALAEGAVRSNARRALDAGASKEEILHVAALTITTRGFPAAVAAFSWVEEVLAAEP